MAEHMIEARILLRYDTYSNWMNSTTILKQGEAALAAFPLDTNIAGTNTAPEHTPPAIGMKIGDGYHRFSELPWLQGVAADVYNWAKQVNKPTYSAAEITGLEQLIEQYVREISGGDITIEPKAYRLYQGTGDDSEKYFLQSRGSNDVTWVTDTNNYIDLTKYSDAISWLGTAYENYWTLAGYITSRLNDKFSALTVEDNAVQNQFVTSVSESNGVITVTRSSINASMINGVLSVDHGGTGISNIPSGHVIIGNEAGAVTTTEVVSRFEYGLDSNLATVGAITRYVDNATAGLTGAMHFIGEATVVITHNSNVDPRISGYDFRQAQPGDVILSPDKAEYVWTGANWRLLGDEGSYAVKGSITNVDIADNAEIDQSKIANLDSSLFSKVDKVSGKALSTNDYTDEEQNKLASIEENAQRNLIEHIFLNDVEATPTVREGKPNSISIRLSSLTPDEEEKLRGIESYAQVNTIEHIFLNGVELGIGRVNQIDKAVNIELIEFTQQEKTKLNNIEAGAQVNTIDGITVNGQYIIPSQDKIVDITVPDHADHINKIEEIWLNGVKLTPNESKQVNIVIDTAAVNFTVIEGARVPLTDNTYENVDIVEDNGHKKLEFSRIAKTGSIYDINNTPASNTTDYLILNCGDASTFID